MLCFKTSTILKILFFIYSVLVFSFCGARALSGLMNRILNRMSRFVSRYLSKGDIMYRYTPCHLEPIGALVKGVI